MPQRGALAGPVQGREQRDEVGAGAGVLDDAAAAAGGPEGLRQAEQVGQPVHDVLLELRGGRAGHPGHALHAQARGHQVAEHRGAGGVGREVAEEAGVLPVGDAGQDDAVQVGQDGGERLALLGGGDRQGGADVAGGDLRADRERTDAASSSRRSSRPPRGRAGGTAQGSCGRSQARSPTAHRSCREEWGPKGPATNDEAAQRTQVRLLAAVRSVAGEAGLRSRSPTKRGTGPRGRAASGPSRTAICTVPPVRLERTLRGF